MAQITKTINILYGKHKNLICCFRAYERIASGRDFVSSEMDVENTNQKAWGICLFVVYLV